MREIKFRAWNTIYKTMSYPKFKTDMLPKNIIGTDYVSYNKECNMLMQYTGLKDKNGVEIYEGDVIGWKFGKWQKEYEIESVRYEPEFGFVPIQAPVSYDDEMIDLSFCEVLGNIYENKELLEGI